MNSSSSTITTDDTVHIAKRFTKRVYVEHAPGAGNARNAGILHAQSDLIVFVDADCIVPTDYLKNHTHIYQTHRYFCRERPYEYADSGKLFTWIWPNGNYFTSLFSPSSDVRGTTHHRRQSCNTQKRSSRRWWFRKTIQDVTHMDDLTSPSGCITTTYAFFFDPSLKILSYLRVEERSL